MKRYTVGAARARLAKALDEAEQGVPVVIERRGVRYRLAVGLGRGQRLYVSPATLLELQFLHEASRIRLKDGSVRWIVDDERWVVDEPPAAAWFLHAADAGWTRDPFDRLLAAHARLRRWRLAKADVNLLASLGPAGSIEV